MKERPDSTGVAGLCFAVCLVLLLLAAAQSALAQTVDLTLEWDTQTSAAGYYIEHSPDSGVTWSYIADVNEPPAVVTVPSTGLQLFRACAYTGPASDRRVRCSEEIGEWFDGVYNIRHVFNLRIR